MNSLFDSHSILVVAPVKPEAQARVAQRLLGYTEGTEKWEMIHKSVSLKYEPFSEPLHISAK